MKTLTSTTTIDEVIFRHYADGDSDRLILRKEQNYLQSHLENFTYDPDSTLQYVWTCEEYHSGEIVAIAGLDMVWEGRWLAWMLPSEKILMYGRPLFRFTQEVLNTHMEQDNVYRVEATADTDFDSGQEWLIRLGFSAEGYLRAYRPDGGDQILFSKVN